MSGQSLQTFTRHPRLAPSFGSIYDKRTSCDSPRSPLQSFQPADIFGPCRCVSPLGGARRSSFNPGPDSCATGPLTLSLGEDAGIFFHCCPERRPRVIFFSFCNGNTPGAPALSFLFFVLAPFCAPPLLVHLSKTCVAGGSMLLPVRNYSSATLPPPPAAFSPAFLNLLFLIQVVFFSGRVVPFWSASSPNSFFSSRTAWRATASFPSPFFIGLGLAQLSPSSGSCFA